MKTQVCIIGGGQIYTEGLASADRLHVTHVAASVEGDASFPQIDPDMWRKVHEEHVPAGERDDFATSYAVYERHPSVP